jgi:hypothetical protein
MHPLNHFVVTNPEPPFNFFEILTVKKKLEVLKSYFSDQIDVCKAYAEISHLTRLPQGLDIIEFCKKNIKQTNQLIIVYNRHTGKLREIKPINENFNLWKTYADNSITGELPKALFAFFDPVVENLGYRPLYNMALTSKATYQLIKKNPCNAFRVRFFCSLEIYIKYRRRAFSYKMESLNSREQAQRDWSKEEYLIFNQAKEQLSNHLKKAKLSDKNITRILQDWMNLQMNLQQIFSTSQNW